MNTVKNDIVTLKAGIGEIVKSLDAIATEKEHIKDIIDSLHEKTDVPKKYIRKMAQLIHKSNVITHRSEMDEFGELLDQVVGGLVKDKQNAV